MSCRGGSTSALRKHLHLLHPSASNEFIQTNVYTNVIEISVILVRQSLYERFTSFLEHCTCHVTYNVIHNIIKPINHWPLNTFLLTYYLLNYLLKSNPGNSVPATGYPVPKPVPTSNHYWLYSDSSSGFLPGRGQRGFRVEWRLRSTHTLICYCQRRAVTCHWFFPVDDARCLTRDADNETDEFDRFFLPRHATRKRGVCCHRWLTAPPVRPSVTLVYCIQTAEDIVKLLSRPGSPIILVFDPQRRYPIPRRIPSAGAQIQRDGKYYYDFRLKSPYISDTVRDRPIFFLDG